LQSRLKRIGEFGEYGEIRGLGEIREIGVFDKTRNFRRDYLFKIYCFRQDFFADESGTNTAIFVDEVKIGIKKGTKSFFCRRKDLLPFYFWR